MAPKKILLIRDKETGYFTSLTHSFQRGLSENGVDSRIVSFDVSRRIFQILDKQPVLQRSFLASSQDKILKIVEEDPSDVVMIIKGFYLLPETLEKIQDMGKKVLCFNPDDPFNAVFGSSNELIRSCIERYDAYFIWSKELMAKLQAAGCVNVFYMPFGADTELIYPMVKGELKDEQFLCDISFIGNPDEERTRYMTGIGELLADWDGKKLIYGNNWEKVEGFNCAPVINGNAYVSTMQLSRINLNILRSQNKNSHNMRTFEIPAAAGFLLHEYSEEVAGFYEEGTEAEFFRSAEECADKIKYYVSNEEERKSIAEKGYHKIQSAGYRYQDILKKLLTDLDTIR